MRQVKLFKSVDTEIAEMEEEMNQWMAQSGIKVISISGNLAAQPPNAGAPMSSFAAGDILLVVLYETDRPQKPSRRP